MITKRGSTLLTVLIASAALRSVTATAMPVVLPDSSPDQQLAIAVEAYQARDYDRAVDAFAAAYAAQPAPDTLFGWAQAERLSGDCPSAIHLYRKLLTGVLAPAQEAAARQNLARCERALGTPAATEPAAADPDSVLQPDAEPDAPTPATAPAAATPTGTTDSSPRAWYKDTWGGVLTGSGVGLLGLATGLYLSAQSARASAGNAYTYDSFQQLHAKADSRETSAALCALTGAALVAGGVVRYVLVHRRSRAHTQIAAAPVAHGAAIVLAGEF